MDLLEQRQPPQHLGDALPISCRPQANGRELAGVGVTTMGKVGLDHDRVLVVLKARAPETLSNTQQVLLVGNLEDDGVGAFGYGLLDGFARSMADLSRLQPSGEVGSHNDVVD